MRIVSAVRIAARARVLVAWSAIALVVTAGAVGVLGCAGPQLTGSDFGPEPSDWISLIQRSLANQAPGIDFRNPRFRQPVSIALRRGGHLLERRWLTGPNWWQVLRSFEASAPEALSEADSLQVCLTYGARRLSLPRDRGRLTNQHRGTYGLELRAAKARVVYSPLEMLERNIGFEQAIAAFSEETGVPSSDVEIRQFEAFQFHVDLVPGPQVVPLRRGTIYVPVPESWEQVGAFAKKLSVWLKKNTAPEGRLVYKYWPSEGRESQRNNLIRQFMASATLGEWARSTRSPEVAALAAANLRYNMDRFYREEGDLGFVEYDGKVKLGAAALAALAIIKSAERGRFERQEHRLLRFVETLWQPSGRFRCWYRGQPPGGSSGQNFYPGEALLLWSVLYEETKHPALLAKMWRSFDFYRTWHRENRNPAFVPWHTRAYVNLWRSTKSGDLADFVFEMNDWLVGLQQWSEAPYDEMRGRFYAPQSPGYGPPHSSSTAVYVEGLAEAFWLARKLGDASRASRYRIAIRRGLRSLMQLQFANVVEAYYVADRDRVLGGVRTTVYDNEIRVDNVQHSLDAAMATMSVFQDLDYVGWDRP